MIKMITHYLEPLEVTESVHIVMASYNNVWIKGYSAYP